MTNAKAPRARDAARFFLSKAALAVALAAGAGCSPPMDRVDFRLDTKPPEAVTVSAERIEITHGIAVGVTALPSAEGEAIGSTVTMQSTDKAIFGVENVAGNQFVFYGTSPGSCTLRITEVTGTESPSGQVDVPVKVIEQAP